MTFYSPQDVVRHPAQAGRVVAMRELIRGMTTDQLFDLQKELGRDGWRAYEVAVEIATRYQVPVDQVA